MRLRTASLTAAAALAGSLLSVTAGTTTAQAADPGACSGVEGCRVVARADVNGDGKRDAIGVARVGSNGDPKGAVIVRVKTGPGKIASVRRQAPYWYGPIWQGVADLDGKKGKEIVVGHSAGAHAQHYRSLTWRKGKLVNLKAPGTSDYWLIDGAVWISAGWLQRPSDPAGTIRQRFAVRTGDATRSAFKGTVTTYRWKPGGWTRVSVETTNPLADSTAYSWGGFRVPGLQRW